MAWSFVMLGASRLFHDIITKHLIPEGELLIPVFNSFALPSLAAVAVMLTAAVLTDRLFANHLLFQEPGGVSLRKNLKTLNFWIGLIGYGFLTSILSVESVQYFQLRSEQIQDASHWGSITLTVLWSVLALILLEIGVVFRSITLRNTAVFGFSVSTVKVVIDFTSRIGTREIFEPIMNPYCAGLIFVSLLLIGVAVQSRIAKRFTEAEKHRWGVLGIIGIFTLLSILSIECYEFFLKYPVPLPIPLTEIERMEKSLIALGTLSILWTLYSAVLLILGLSFRSKELRACSLIILLGVLIKIGGIELFQRPDYHIAFLNPYFLTMLCPTLFILFAAVWTLRIKPLENETERNAFLMIGFAGLTILWVFLSVECFAHFDRNPFLFLQDDISRRFVATASLSVLWTALAAVLIVTGISRRSVWLRGFGLFVFAVTAGKILCLELFRRPVSEPVFEFPLLNPYFLTIAVCAAAMIGFAVWTTRMIPLEDDRERIGFFSFGITGTALLWASLSVECFDYFNIRTDLPNHQFLATAALTVFWAVLAIAVAVVAGITRSKPLRVISVGLLLLTLLKVVPGELWERPAYMTPFLNPYAVPLGLLALALIFVCVGLISMLNEKDAAERNVYQFLAFSGVVFL
jgi:uncharacterized membrane protein